MIKAELSYNPYLGKTDVRFNGQTPKINSLVEKYSEDILNDWIDLVPEIFHDEMNGYGFELDFTGTALDCRNLRSAFQRLNIAEDDVEIFHKNELESRVVKVERIERLLDWLEKNPNRNFDYASFKQSNTGLLDDLYIYKIIQGENIEADSLKNEDIAVENINSIQELDPTNLTYVPILIYVSERSINSLRRNIQYLKDRDDVKPNQVFFYISEAFDVEKITRVIHDLGVRNPQIVSELYDEKIKEYFEIYPITEYIRDTVIITREITANISNRLAKQDRDNQITERRASTTAFKSDFNIQELKKLDDAFANRDNIDIPESFKSAKETLLSTISNWRNKKTVITTDDEALTTAHEFEMMFSGAYEAFWNSINVSLIREEEIIQKKYQSMYASGGIDMYYRPSVDLTSRIPSFSAPSFQDALMNIKDERYVKQKDGIIDQVFKNNSSTKFMERVIAYYYKDWRAYVLKLASDMADKDIDCRLTMVKQYASSLAEAYQSHINKLLTEEISKKNNEMNQLSEAEKLLQIDTDWLNAFVDQINAIERG